MSEFNSILARHTRQFLPCPFVVFSQYLIVDDRYKKATRGWQMTQYLFYFPASSGGVSNLVDKELLYVAVVSREHIATHTLIYSYIDRFTEYQLWEFLIDNSCLLAYMPVNFRMTCCKGTVATVVDWHVRTYNYFLLGVEIT
jgi:hypothetical protein